MHLKITVTYLFLFLLKISEKKKKLKKDGKDTTIPEDDPVKYKHAIYVMVMKVI